MLKFGDRIRAHKQNLFNRYRLCIQKDSAQECYNKEQQRLLNIKLEKPKVDLYNCVNGIFQSNEENVNKCMEEFKGKVSKILEDELTRVGG